MVTTLSGWRPAVRPWRDRRLAAVVALILASAVAPACGGAAPDEATLAEDEPTAPDDQTVLQAVAELARQDSFYLVVDAPARSLVLYRGRSPLRSWTVAEVEAGARRTAVGRGVAVEDWRTHVWRDGQVRPVPRRERRIIESDSVLPPDPTGAEDVIPPTPEEAVPAPATFRVAYAGGMSLVVESVDGGDPAPFGLRMSRRLQGLSRMPPWRWDRYQVRVRMPATETGSLYRSLPSGIPLIAVLEN